MNPNKILPSILISMLIAFGTCWGLPEVGRVEEGSADIQYNSDNTSMTINAADKTVISYNSFNINSNESVVVILPSNTSEILNRVTGAEISNLLGSLDCNGIFILVNPAGINIGPNANIQAQGLVLSTRDIQNNDFMNGNYIFKKITKEELNGLILNQGAININRGGFASLIAAAIDNKGLIMAPLGKISLAAGDAVTLQIADGGLISVAIDEGVASQIKDSSGNPITDQITNTGTLDARGGAVLIEAQSLPGIFARAINLEGYIRADKFEEKDGRIRITASQASPIDINADLDTDNLYVNGISLGSGRNISGLPLYFIPNEGLIDDLDVKFYVKFGNSLYYFTPYGMYFMLQYQDPLTGNIAWIPIQFQYLGSNSGTNISSGLMTGAIFNYFLGNDPSKWKANVPSYYQILYDDLYTGIDLVYTSRNGQLESEFTVQPGADYEDIKIKYSNIESMNIDNDGSLVMTTQAGDLVEAHPYVYQNVNGAKIEIPAQFRLLSDNTYGFNIKGAYDPAKPIVIDPTFSYSTYLGGTGIDVGNAIAVDSSGNMYVTGYTNSIGNFPTASPYQAANAGIPDVFVTKFNSAGSALTYSTYLGGSSSDSGNAIAVDSSGNAYITGYTASGDFPTASPYQAAFVGIRAVFVTKFNSAGSALTYSTFLGGATDDAGYGITVDASNNAYVTGTTQGGFPTTAGAYQTVYGDHGDAFITKFQSDGSALTFSTYLGGSAGTDIAYSVALDTSNNVYVAGSTTSSNFPTQSPYQAALSSVGNTDAFVTKFNSTGTALTFSTFLGGAAAENYGYGIAVDTSNNVYVTGYTASASFPTASAYQPAYAGNNDAFITKFNSAGSALTYSTYLGGASGTDIGYSIAVDTSNNVYVTGSTASTNFPTASPYQAANAGLVDAFVTQLQSDGSALTYSTYLGGTGNDYGRSIVFSSDNAYIAGDTTSADFPTASPYQAAAGGSGDAFVSKFAFPASPSPSPSPEPPQPPEPPTPPPPPTPPDPGGGDSSGDNVNTEDKVNTGKGEYEAKKYEKAYISGKYRTVVIVFEGKVAMAPYDEKGPKYDKAVLLGAGMTNSATDEIKKK